MILSDTSYLLPYLSDTPYLFGPLGPWGRLLLCNCVAVTPTLNAAALPYGPLCFTLLLSATLVLISSCIACLLHRPYNLAVPSPLAAWARRVAGVLGLIWRQAFTLNAKCFKGVGSSMCFCFPFCLFVIDLCFTGRRPFLERWIISVASDHCCQCFSFVCMHFTWLH